MQRYGSPSPPTRVKSQQTILLLLLLALTIACISLAIAHSSASRINDNIREVLVSRVRTEVTYARQGTAQLLPTGGSKTEALVAIVRQHIYAVRAINEMTKGIYGVGVVLVTEQSINNCIEFLNECDRKIQTGEVVTDTYDKLSNAVEILYNEVSALQ